MTVINPNSISGITSITLPAGADNVLTIHTNDGVERFRIDSTGNIKVGSAATISPDGDLFVTGVCTATTLAGAASGLTGTLPAISGANLTNLTAGNLTGALPAISGANLTGIAATDNVRTGILDVAGVSTFRNTMNVGAAVTISESGIEASGIGITCASINGTQIGGRRNLIMNGAMQVAQRGTSTTMSGSSSTYLCDRWRVKTTSTDNVAMTISQDATSYPTDFRQCLKIDITTAETTLDSNEYLQVQQRIEAQNLQHINNGTSNAKSLVLSFYVKAYQAGNYAVAIYKGDNTQRLITLPYTINASATWEKKVVVIPADTSGGGIANDTGIGYQLDWFLAAGSGYTSTDSTSWINYASTGYAYGQAVNTMSSTDNYWQITGVQLEIGSTATAFEFRSYGEELALCQRYFHSVINQGWLTAGYQGSYLALGVYLGGSKMAGYWYHPVPMRSNPTLIQGTVTNGWGIYRADGNDQFNDLGGIITNSAALHGKEFTLTEVSSNVSGSGGDSGIISVSSDDAYVQFSSEL